MNRFFRALWRINAVLICVASILVVSVSTVAAYYVIKNILQPTNMHGVAKAEEPNVLPSEKDWRISRTERIEGSNIVRCEVSSGDYYRGGSFSKGSTSAIRNYLYYDLTSGAVSWLLPASTPVIIAKEDFYFPDSPVESREVKWTSFTVADKDTNNDGQLSSADLLSYAVSRANGTAYLVLLNDLDEVLDATLVGESELVVFYRKGGKSFVSKIDLKEQKVISTTSLLEKK